MASTYSALKIELIATGEQSGTWGTTTNNNLGDAALGEAITGSADVAFSSADVTVTLTDSNASQAARNLRLNLTGTSGGARQLILGAGCQIEKLYLINNGLADAVTVKNTSGSGITVPAGKSTFVFNNGTNVVEAANYFPGTASSGANSDITSLSGLATPLSIAQGGTGTNSTTFTNLATNVTGTLPIANGGTGSTSTTFVDAATNITGTLPIANGGTGATTLRAATISTLGYTTTVTAAGTTTLTATSTAAQFFTGSTTQTIVLPVASTMTQGQQFTIHNNSSGSLTINSSGPNLVGTLTANTTATVTCILTSGTDALSWDFDLTGFTTALPVARGGTGLTAIGTANQVLAVNAGATALEFQSAAAGGFSNMQVFTGPGTWTNPGAVTKVKVTVVGGGGNGGGVPGGNPSGNYDSGGGSGGGTAVGVKTIPTSPVSVTVGGATGTSSFGPFISATGGTTGGTRGSNTFNTTAGVGSGGDINMRGGIGGPSGGPMIMGGGAAITGIGFGIRPNTANGNGQPAQPGAYGAGGTGAPNSAGGGTGYSGGTGEPGVVIVEW
jgi:hypothetical protein